MTSENIKRGLGPLTCPNARVLILGSLPGDYSIRQQQYYAHPQNQFWRMLAAVYDEPPCMTYDDKRALLTRHRIAVWDVLASAERPGSLDTAIRNGEPNDILTLLDAQPDVRRIVCNGQKAHGLFQRHFGQKLNNLSRPISIACLPSTSPAATRAFGEKFEEWRAFLDNGP
ncbi:MAG: DNA-deoxyinosine glycosylase [Hyphomicrobium sp.]|nr:DNA-deoxyinosine glycosylase [Hyphomicrobium sp.]